MNPFDFSGPDFLFFFGMLAVAAAVVAHTVRKRFEFSRERVDGSIIRRGLIAFRTKGESSATDPYAIAFLRGGKNELLRVTVISLIDRQLLDVDNVDSIVSTALGQRTAVRKRVEERVIAFCLVPRTVKDLFASDAFDDDARMYDEQLQRQGLIPDGGAMTARVLIFLFAALPLAILALGKIFIALNRGHGNITVLIVFAIAAVAALVMLLFPRQTASGQRLLKELRNLFQALRLRAAQIRRGGSTAEVALVAAVFGTGALTSSSFTWTKQLFPKTSSPAGSCGASCGSSCGGSCGGGCGGGCGGCGG